MIRVGLTSTALLSTPSREVLDLARRSGLEAVEWADEAHQPCDAPAAAESLLMDSLRAGLTVASYVSLYRLGVEGGERSRFEALLRTAAILQAPILRIYVDAPGGRAAPPGLAGEARRLGDLAAARGITLCLSLGRGTGLDRYAVASAFVAEVAHPFVRAAWEPLPGASADQASAALEGLGRHVGMLIARRVDRAGRALCLSEETEAWRRRLAAFKAAETEPGLGSFVLIGALRGEPGSDESGSCLAEDAALLCGLAEEVGARPKRKR